MSKFFAKVATTVSSAVGSPYAFIAALLFVLAWGLSGPVFGFSETWQLVVNTGTTIVTFLMVFIIQNAQNRDQKALQLKLDELLRAVGEAKTGFVDLESLDDETLNKLKDRFGAMRDKHEPDVDEAVK